MLLSFHEGLFFSFRAFEKWVVSATASSSSSLVITIIQGPHMLPLSSRGRLLRPGSFLSGASLGLFLWGLEHLAPIKRPLSSPAPPQPSATGSSLGAHAAFSNVHGTIGGGHRAPPQARTLGCRWQRALPFSNYQHPGKEHPDGWAFDAHVFPMILYTLSAVKLLSGHQHLTWGTRQLCTCKSLQNPMAQWLGAFKS